MTAEPSKRRILLVDDDHDLTDIMSLLISETGVGSCVTAHSLAEVRACPEVASCDVAIVDINLRVPDATGLDVATWLRAHGFRGKVVFLTGHARSSPLVVAASRTPGTVLLTKPIRAEELLELVEGPVS